MNRYHLYMSGRSGEPLPGQHHDIVDEVITFIATDDSAARDRVIVEEERFARQKAKKEVVSIELEFFRRVSLSKKVMAKHRAR